LNITWKGKKSIIEMWENKELQTAFTITQCSSASNLTANPNRKLKENGMTLSVYSVIVLKRVFCDIILEGLLC
jgi:hypothetical protein